MIPLLTKSTTASDDVVWLAPIAAIVVALVSGFFAWYVPAWKVRREARVETARALRHNRDPLLRAAFELQSRFYNIVARDFLKRYLANGIPDEKDYAVLSTLWLVGQYLGWVEILRREVQYLDLGSRAVNRRLQLRLSEVSAALASDSRRMEDSFIIFRSDQRAVGEFMVTARDTGTGGTRPDCLGYSEFLERFRVTASEAANGAGLGRPPLLAWADRFETDLQRAADEPDKATRLVRAQRRLIDLVDLLDPDRVRYPELNFRGKLPIARHGEPPRRAAHFLWRHADPWPSIERWARESGFRLESQDAFTRTFRGRRGATLKRPEVSIRYEGGWLTFDGGMTRRHKRSAIDGSLRNTRARVTLNRLLRTFDRPTVAVGSTLPSRIGRWVITLVRRLRRGAEDHES